MNKNSNAYTFIFAIIMVIVVAVTLSFTATSLGPLQKENVRKEKMQNILLTIGIETDRENAEELFDKYISQQLSLNSQGEKKEGVNAFEVDLAKELSKPDEEQTYPIYIANYEGSEYYIAPLRGSGLWDAIWGYIALEDDANTVKGVVFDHKGETAGLGAEITTDWFQQRFVDEKIFNDKGELVGVNVVKGYSGGNDKDDNKVDSISGATITSDGVSEMIEKRLKNYLPFFKKRQDIKVVTR
ncbi:NADH:ubiquinone reductase (Na(+)-transporting) subunit C [Psychroflexus sp. CAK57W]|uniref:NADH:ubiquinone reductase (Na(+)-transporting) subunit C n=1 Tax=Psychroflexus curvus TaxID=2873595 RepID=UPI001CCFB3C1|nr:NADH:ubiquinone reductase (Na(+)-transporting) subunit C [Psychroflexus curvus]MBZ9627404.1 NADH:ubiquinone reductase (Na(+)-transporting) subunit C [Psychroflexus curvus]MBZ9785911.1 NADH:ubiquinone reductase (Na(+)-transporting) subunit C [Psychroflexus curvus]